MAPNPRRVNARLDAVYAKLPELECQGLCSDSCGPVPASIGEKERIRREAGRPLACGAKATCTMLTEHRRCGVYDIRPMLCRLWGLVENMPCPYGCVPEGGRLSAVEGFRLLAEAMEAGGGGDLEYSLAEVERIVAELGDQAEPLARAATRAVGARPTLQGRDGAIPRSVIERRN